jgi:hypothetical protein
LVTASRSTAARTEHAVACGCGRVHTVLESLTGAAPSAGFVHGMLARAAQPLDECDKRIAALPTLAYVVYADETPLRVGALA